MIERQRILGVVVASACALLVCATPAATGGWREIAPLPSPRFFHRGGIGAGGRVYAWAGLVGRPKGGDDYGVHQRALVAYDPKTNAWSQGPPAPDLRERVRAKLVTNRPELKGKSGPVRESPQRLNHEYPPGVAANGRMYWFASSGPLWFDSERGVWDQGEPPLRDQAKHRWISSVASWVRHNNVTAAGPDGRIYLVGGTGQPMGDLPPERTKKPPPGDVVALLDSLEIYDPATLTWSEGAPMRHARQLFAGTFGADGKLYVFGGYGHRGGVSQRPGESDADYDRRTEEMIALGRHALRSVEAYDPKTNTWSDRAPMPEGRHAMGAGLGADGRIYVIGGAVRYSRPTPTDSVFVYDPRTDTWERGPSLNQARYHHAVAAGPDGKIYAIGGTSGTRSGRGGPLASVEVLDTAASGPGKDLAPVGERIGPEEARRRARSRRHRPGAASNIVPRLLTPPG